MATVTVFTADRIIEFENEDLVSGIIDENGDLILQKRGGTVVNVGNVKDHGQLTGLADDDHPLYALADGSRGDFRPTIQALTELNGGDPTGTLETVVITDDGTLTDNWVNRIVFQYKDNALADPRLTFFINEFGEIRVAPSAVNRTAFRAFVKELPTNPAAPRDPDVPVMELMDNRVDRNVLWGLVGDGTTVVNGLRMSYTLVLGPADPVPADTPPNTVIVRTT